MNAVTIILVTGLAGLIALAAFILYRWRSLFQKLLKKAPGQGKAAPEIEGNPVYRPEVFAIRSIDEAKRIILTPEHGTTTGERWEKETPYLRDQIIRHLKPGRDESMLDYGCGIGRMAKEIIAASGCKVVGVDISPQMRQLAPGYVDSPGFSVCSPEQLQAMIGDGLRVDHAISLWVLQHCLNPIEDIANIRKALKPGGLLFVLNNDRRAVPTSKGWFDDGIDIRELLRGEFQEIHHARLPQHVTTPQIAQLTFMQVLRKPPG